MPSLYAYLSNTCDCRYGQFDSAKETFEVIADYESMLDLFICHLNPSAMRRLAQKLEEESADSELRRYCERILRVRSTGWTQGIFANFAAESMVPKGAEWGGGNWEIKTPTKLKDIPQWALAAEVMPYMRTDDGTIPSIVTDHIGVYLGLIKGRGNVVEVREDSLVKAIKADSAITANGPPTSLATQISNKSNRSASGDSNIGSLMGLETLNQQFTGSSAVDAQAKAEEEFKKSLYGAADDSSSDEEGTSKTKKLQIRIRDKPVTSATVDVNKIKEATKQLGLPMSRTKSSTGSSQDLGLLLPQPATATTGTAAAPVSAPTDIFGTNALIQPPPVSQPMSKGPGFGVSARPIPEDFFQNTISSIQVAASLPPPGTFLSRMDQNAQSTESNKAPAADQGSVPPVDIGLPDGGKPPQATQPATPAASVGTLYGAIPPHSLPQASAPVEPQMYPGQFPASVPAQLQMYPGQFPGSSQPIDLSSLEGPGSERSGQPPAPSASSPKAVRPGQVVNCFFLSAWIILGIKLTEKRDSFLLLFNNFFLY